MQTQAKSCAYCGKPVGQYKRAHAAYCNDRCANRHWQQKHPTEKVKNDWTPDISPGTTGAVQEMLVCADLMKKGFHVFRAVSPS